jgi:hypothetical protein
MKCNVQILPQGGFKCEVCETFSYTNDDRQCAGKKVTAQTATPCCGKTTPMATPNEKPALTREQVQKMRKRLLALKPRPPKAKPERQPFFKRAPVVTPKPKKPEDPDKPEPFFTFR